MAGTKLKALIRPLSRGHDEVDTVDLELMNPDGSPYSPGGGGGGAGGGPSLYINGHGLQKSVMGVSDFLYFDGTENGLAAEDMVGIDPDPGQSIELPPGIYTSSWQVGFDTNADDGVGDTVRGFSAQIQPLGRALEWYPIKPAGGWVDFNPYPVALGFNFIVPAEGNDLIVSFDGTTADSNGVTYYLSFTLIKLGDLPA